MNRFSPLLCLGGLLLTAALPAEETSYLLRYKFQPDQSVHYDVRDVSELTTRHNAFVETAKNNSEVRRHFRVVSVNAQGVATLELSLDRVKMTAQFGNHPEVKYDSTAKDVPPKQFREVHRAIGTVQARGEFSRTGQLLKVIPVGPGAKEIADLSSNTQNPLVVFPEEPVKLQGAWKETLTVDVAVDRTLKRPVKLLRTYKLEKVEDGIAEISLQTVVITPVNDPALEAQLIQRTPGGVVRFDLEKGMLLSRKLTVEDSVIGAFGAQSSVAARSEHLEKLVTAEELAAEKPQREPLSAPIPREDQINIQASSR